MSSPHNWTLPGVTEDPATLAPWLSDMEKSRARDQTRRTATGIISETCALSGIGGTAIPTAGNTNGSVVLGLVGLLAGDVVTNIVVAVAVASASLTFAKMGLYKKDGTFIAATAEFSAALNTVTGPIVQPLTTPYTITADDGYYAAFLQWGNLATGATLMRGNTTSVTSGVAMNNGARDHATVAAQTDLAGNVALANGGTGFWLAVA